MSVVLLGESIKKDKYILEIDKKLLEEMEDYLFWKILEETKKEQQEVFEKDVFDLIKSRIN